MNRKPLSWGLVFAGFLLSTIAFAQSLPLFGSARFDQAQFGAALPATPVPILPSSALITLAVLLWVLSFLFSHRVR